MNPIDHFILVFAAAFAVAYFVLRHLRERGTP